MNGLGVVVEEEDDDDDCEVVGLWDFLVGLGGGVFDGLFVIGF